MAKKAPGKSHREGITIVELMDMFPTEEAATQWFEGRDLARRAPLREVRQHADKGSPERKADALLVHGLPVLFQRPHGNADCAVQCSAP